MEDQRKVENLGKNIQYVRKNICHMTQDRFSEAVSISIEQLQKIEQGKSLPSIPSLFAIANYAGVPLDFLGKDDIEPSELNSAMFLMEEIRKYDRELIENTVLMLQAVYARMRGG